MYSTAIMLARSLPLVFLFALGASNAPAANYAFTILNPTFPGYIFSLGPAAINDHGHVLYDAFNQNTGIVDTVFLQDEQGLHRIQIPGVQPTVTFAHALSTDDTIGGTYYTGPNAYKMFELKQNRQLRIMPPPPSDAASPFYAMNDSGDFTLANPPISETGHPYYFAKGQYIPVQYPGVTEYSAMGISNNDTVVGTLFDLNEGYALRNGVFTLINVPGASLTIVNCISDNDSQIGGVFEDSAGEHAFVLSKPGGFSVLDFPFPASIGGSTGDEPLTSEYTEVDGVNDHGVVCGKAEASYSDGTTTNFMQFYFTAAPQNQ